MRNSNPKGFGMQIAIMSNNNGKKDVIWPGLRMESDMAKRLRDAFDKLGVDGPNFRRKIAEDIIDIAESGDRVDMPPRIMRIKRRNAKR